MNEVASLDSKHADVVGPTSTANSEDLQLPEELIAQPGAEELVEQLTALAQLAG